MNKLLRRPDWQVFIYTVFGNILIPTTELGIYLRVLYGLVFLVWVLKVNEELYHRLQGRTVHSLTFIQVTLIITFCYISIIMLFTNGYNISTEKDNYAEYGWLVWIYVPFPFSYLWATCMPFFLQRLLWTNSKRSYSTLKKIILCHCLELYSFFRLESGGFNLELTEY